MTPCPVSATARNSASSSARSDQRLGIGWPSAPRWVTAKLVANPAAPASIASRTWSAIAATSSAVAVRREASSPITKMRSAVCPM